MKKQPTTGALSDETKTSDFAKPRLAAVLISGCAHIDSVITRKELEIAGFFIPSDIKKIHITFRK